MFKKKRKITILSLLLAFALVLSNFGGVNGLAKNIIVKAATPQLIIPSRSGVMDLGKVGNCWRDTDVIGSNYLLLLKKTSQTVTPTMNFNNYGLKTLDFREKLMAD